jgi:hypothetical protein
VRLRQSAKLVGLAKFGSLPNDTRSNFLVPMESEALGFPFELGPTRTIKSGFRENASHSQLTTHKTTVIYVIALTVHGYCETTLPYV